MRSSIGDGYSVRVLGPLTVSANGSDADIGGPKQRLLLALLLADIDSVVSNDRLIAGLWGEEPPATARKAVQVHVSNLRRALGDDFPLKTAPGGYVVQSAGLNFDALAFETELGAAKAQLRTDPLAAERIMSDAIGRWAGPPYADLDAEPALEPEIARLNELRLQALEGRLDAGLRAGRHADVMGELATLSAENPYRERFTELFMLALYRSGRQTEALRAYQRTRSMLVEELGVEPGPSLQALQQQILEHSADLNLADDGADGRYAFLATDIEASTAMWEAEPEAMQGAIARHDEILADAVTSNAGTVFKATGDGIFAVFAAATDALQAAVDGQQALNTEPWATTRPIRVRMGVDEGPASARGGDYFGPALNRVSRVMSSGHGGQVLCPAELRSQAPVPTRDLGGADYKGIGRLDVSQVDVPGLPDRFPDLQTDRTPKTTIREGFGRAIRGYELRERLGEGAHGVVYRAYQAAVGREVAIKVIRPEHANRAEFVNRFEAEAQFVAQLEHPHIVSLYDYWRDPDGAYLVMQLLRGGSLATSLERAPWRPPAALQLLDQVGAALDYAHRQGIMHRDLKPANVVLDAEGNAYLSDFGIASQHVQAVGVPDGSSVAYVSPEELAGDAVGLAADMYGMALLTYEVLTGDRPVLGGQPAPITDRRQDLPPSLDQVLARAADPDPAKRFDRVDDFLRALRQVFGADVVTHQRRAAPSEIRNPYKGLRAFAETDANDFFGRDDLVRELVDHVSTHRLTAVVGPSGSGKSSLVRAGLLPQVRRAASTGKAAVLVTDMFPGSYPFEELEAALSRVAVDRQDGLLAELVADDRGLLRMSKQLLPDDDSELLLVIDQFEELFLLTHDDAARRQFLASLVAVAGDERSRVRVVVTMRADHFDRPLADPEFGALVRHNVVPISMPTHDELTRAIAQPAASAGLEFEAGLIPRIVHDVADEPGALPLMQYALTELVRAREGAELTIGGYESTGGVTGALTLRAEEIYDGLSPGARDAAREVFLRLVAVDETADDTRRRVRRAELDSLGLGETALDAVLDAYGAFRLLSFDRDPVTRGPTVEVAHEALIREWPRFRGWVDERREDLLLERRLASASAEWDASNREPSFLFGGGQLDQYEQWATATDVRLTATERDFIDGSRREADAERAARRRRRTAVLTTLALFTVVALAAAVVAVLQRNDAEDSAARAESAQLESDDARAAAEGAAAAEREARASADAAAAAEREARTEADAARTAETRSRALSDARLLAATAPEIFTKDQDAGLLLAVAASDLLDAVGAETPEVMGALLSTATEHRALHRFDVSPQRLFDQRTIPLVSSDHAGDRLAVLTTGDDGATPHVRIIDVETGRELRRLDGLQEPTSVLWDHLTGELLVGRDGALTIVDPDSGESVELVDAVPGPVNVLSTSPDHVVYAYTQLTSQVTNTVVADRSTGEPIRTYVRSFWVDISPDGDLVHVSPMGRDDTDDAQIETFPAGEPIPTTITNNVFDWTADGDLLVEQNQSLLRLEPTGSVVAEGQTLTGPFNTVASARLSPDGRWIAIEGAEGAVHVHDAATLETADRLVLSDGVELRAITWSGDSRHLITIDSADEAVVWDLGESRRAPASTWTGSTGGLPYSAQVDEHRLALGGSDGQWELWDTAAATRVATSAPAEDVVLGSVAFHSERGLVASPTAVDRPIEISGVDGTRARLIDTDEFDNPLAFSPDGNLLAVAHTPTSGALARNNGVGGLRTFGLYDIERGIEIVGHRTANETGTSSAAFSQDGKLVLFPHFTTHGPLDRAGGVLIYDTSSGELAASLDVLGGAVSAQVSPDGRQLAVGGGRGSIELHDFTALLAERPSLIGRTSTGRGELTTGVAFSDDGATVFTREVLNDYLSAWSADEEMELEWEWKTPLGSFAIELRDGLLWIQAHGALPLDPHPGHLGLIGIPPERGELADFARGKATREFTEAECQTYLSSSCAEFAARVT